MPGRRPGTRRRRIRADPQRFRHDGSSIRPEPPFASPARRECPACGRDSGAVRRTPDGHAERRAPVAVRNLLIYKVKSGVKHISHPTAALARVCPRERRVPTDAHARGMLDEKPHSARASALEAVRRGRSTSKRPARPRIGPPGKVRRCGRRARPPARFHRGRLFDLRARGRGGARRGERALLPQPLTLLYAGFSNGSAGAGPSPSPAPADRRMPIPDPDQVQSSGKSARHSSSSSRKQEKAGIHCNQRSRDSRFRRNDGLSQACA